MPPIAMQSAATFIARAAGHIALAAALLSGCAPAAQESTPQTRATTTATVTASAVSASASAAPAPPPPPKRSWLEQTLLDSDPRFEQWLAQSAELRFQILVHSVDANGNPGKTYRYRSDEEYFYPASAIKLFLAVEALRHTSKKLGSEIPLSTRILRCRIGKAGCKPPREDAKKDEEGQPKVPEDKKKHRKLRIGQEIHKMLSYSDNDSFNRLYDIVGHRELNEAMAELGFASVRFHHKMNAPAPRSRKTPRVVLLPPGKRAIRIKLRKSDLELAATNARGLKAGKGYRDHTGLVEEPLDFGKKNATSLSDLQRMLLSIVLPNHPNAVALGMSDKQQAHLVRAMKARLSSRKRAAEHGPLTPGVVDVLGLKRSRYISKSGRAYGFHLENAFVQDTKTKRGFFATVVVYVNPNGILNDDDYAYDDTSKPLLAAVGKALTQALLGDSADAAPSATTTDEDGAGGKDAAASPTTSAQPEPAP